MTTATARKPVSREKRAMLCKVHIARKDLALDEDSYRAVLERITGKRSAAQLRQAELHDVIEEFKRLGWKAKKTGPKRAGKRALADGGQAAKIRALWLDLYHLGELRDPSEEALAGFVARVTGVEALQWVDGDQADRVIKALRGWLTRIGFRFADAPARHAIAVWRQAAGLEPAAEGFADKVALLDCQWKRIKDSGTMKFAFFMALGEWLAKTYGPAAPYFLSPQQADLAVEELGRWVRRIYEVGS